MALVKDGVTWDGVENPYIPGETLDIDPSLQLHTEADENIDPVTYEVLRYNLWNINEEHGLTIQKTSGSPIAIYAMDFNPSLLTENAEFIYYGPYMQYMSGVTDNQIKWTMENRSSNPGIGEGDMFLSNDPWVGAAHQQDVTVLCPVFWEGKLFCWVADVLHHYDLGGITPSSFCPGARDVFDEPAPFPPVKIVERGVLRRDIEALHLRRSRKPNLVALDLRSQIAGNTVAKERILRLLERYGAATIKGVMRKIINNAEQSFLRKLRRLPDGLWREQTYIEVAYPGDRHAYRAVLTVTKEGDKLIFENVGTAPQVGAINTTYSGWRGSILTALNQMFCYDQLYCVAGAVRHLEFRPTLGTFTVAKFPAAVSSAPIQGMETSLNLAQNALGKMVACDAELKRDLLCICGNNMFATALIVGVNQHGERYGIPLTDPMGGAFGAFSFRDGISTGGMNRTPIGELPNVEYNEQIYPMLYLSRHEMTDSGGAGKYKGGNGAILTFVLHDTDLITHTTVTSGAAVPTGIGIFAGYPAGPNGYALLRDSDVRARLGRGELPTEVAEIVGEPVLLHPRQEGILQHWDDVFAVWWGGGAAYGDPLERDPEWVRRDVRLGYVSPQAAHDIHAVVLAGKDLTVDGAATASLRQSIREQRLAQFGRRPQERHGEGRPALMLVGEYLKVVTSGEEKVFACVRCDQELGSVAGNYKLHCLAQDRPMTEASPAIADPARYLDEDYVFRQFYCPGCGALIENEVTRRGEPPLWDVQLRLL